jgi:predicted permease
MIADLRYAVRQLVRKPVFTIVALLTLALGVGANSAIFSIVNAVLLRPLPVDRPEELVDIYTLDGDETFMNPHEYPDYMEIARDGETFAGVAAYAADFVSMTVGTDTEVLFGENVSGNYFEVLGIPAVRGRLFRDGLDDQPGVSVAVIGNNLWRRQFGADPDVIGKTITLKGKPFEIVGVVPDWFKGVWVGFNVDVWIPAAAQTYLDPSRDGLEVRSGRNYLVKGRLQPGVTQEQVQARMDLLGARLGAAFPETNAERTFHVIPSNDVRFHPNVDGYMVPVAALLMTVVGLLLLIVCSNLANLMIARALGRRREIAIRLAIGAGRARLVRQLLTESLLLAVVGGALGLLLAWGITTAIVRFQPPILISLSLDLGLDATVLAFTFGIAVLAGILFGLVPALQATNPQLVPALKDLPSTSGSRYRRLGLRNVLVVVQVAISMVLLVGAGLFVRSLIAAQDIDPGFEGERAVVMTVAPGLTSWERAHRDEVLDMLLERARALPGVEAAAMASRLPLGAAIQTNEIFPVGADIDMESPPSVDVTRISPDYFRTLDVPLLEGRDFTESDNAEARLVVIVSEATVRRHWPGESAIGKTLRLGDPDGPVSTVIGVARDTRVRTLGEAPRPYVYQAWLQSDESFMSLVARTSGEPGPLLPILQREVRAIAEDLPVMELKTMSEHLGLMLFAPRMGGILLAIFGGLAALLATLGLYGVVAYTAAMRTREVGIRVSVGARPADIVRLMISQGAAMVGVGAAIGLGLAFLATRPLGSMLYGIDAFDPLTFGGVGLLLVLVGLAATLVPAIRASRLDPVNALRYE